MEQRIIDQLKQTPHFVWSHKICLRHIEGRGMSVVCAEPIAPGELLIRVPPQQLINVSTLGAVQPDPLLDPHDALALRLIELRNEGSDLWVQSLPPRFDFMPAMWPADQRDKLPRRYLPKVAHQIDRIAKLSQLSGLPLDDVAWAWLAVNTRCLYWEKGGMTLAPGIDYLNHTCNQKEGLKVESSLGAGITVTATHRYMPGQELTFCYGPHENGFLLAEYGFMATENPWNFVDISSSVEQLVAANKTLLESIHYWGDYTVDSDGEPSFRVEVALASLQTSARGLSLVANGYDDGQRYAQQSRQWLADLARREKYPTDLNDTLSVLYEEYRSILAKVQGAKVRR